MLYNKAGSGDI